MAKLSWTEQAISDINDICDFIAKDSPFFARLFADKIFNATEKLKNFPEAGRVVPELDKKSIREIVL